MNRLAEFLQYVNKGKAVLFLGAGISKIAGCMGLKELCQEIKELETMKQDLKGQVIPSRELIALCRSRIQSDSERLAFDGVIKKGLYPDPDKLSREYLPFIRNITKIKPFPPILTTNIDLCLTSSKQFEMSQIFSKKEHMKMEYLRSGSIFHLHGSLEGFQEQIWDIDDYTKRYRDQDFRNFVETVFRDYSILFLGYSFCDGELLSMLREAAKISPAKYHYTLLPEDDYPRDVNEVAYRELYNIEVIKYPTINNFVAIVREWVDSNYEQITIVPQYDPMSTFDSGGS